MKKKSILLIACVITSFFACKKENNYPVTGTWQETKLRVYTAAPSGAILNDTTYSGSTFTSLDYIQFNNNGTCILSSDHEYSPGGHGLGSVPIYNLSRGMLNYKAIGSNLYILVSSSNLINPGGFSSTDTVSMIDQNNLLSHNVNYSNFPTGSNIIYDSYYVR